MSRDVFTQSDLAQILAHGMTPEKVISQIDIFKKGIPFTKILRPCTINDGITALDSKETDHYIGVLDDARKQGRCMKFVPASGAASRMFKYLLETCNELRGLNDPETMLSDDRCKPLLLFINGLEKYAFYDDLKKIIKQNGEDPDVVLKAPGVNRMLEYLLS
ncbi:MAG: DUF4301 family protein, partial [Deltaproteobacteria bacterium]|nr:DUF4301 family protein [Deltaproteobacteria bacterium]